MDGTGRWGGARAVGELGSVVADAGPIAAAQSGRARDPQWYGAQEDAQQILDKVARGDGRTLYAARHFLPLEEFTSLSVDFVIDTSTAMGGHRRVPPRWRPALDVTLCMTRSCQLPAPMERASSQPGLRRRRPNLGRRELVQRFYGSDG
jgi:hypothetical protein